MMGMHGISVSCLAGKPGRRVIAGCLAIILLVVGCADKQKVPSGILPLSKMQSVMWDMIQADQYAALAIAKDSVANRPATKGSTAKDSTAKDSAAKDPASHIIRINVKAETLKLYEQVFRLHDVSREDFNKSYQYYLAHPELNQLLFDSLLSQGSRLRTESYSRPVSNHPSPIVLQHPPTGPPSPIPGGTLLHSTVIPPAGRPRTFPLHQPFVAPGIHPVIPVTSSPKIQKDSARKHT